MAFPYHRSVFALACIVAVCALTGTTAGQWGTPAGRMWHTEVDRATLARFQTEVVLDEPRQRQAERLYEAHLDRFDEFVEDAKAHLAELAEQRQALDRGTHDENVARLRRHIAIADIAIEQIELDRLLLNNWKDLLLEEEQQEAWPAFDLRWRREAWLRARARFNDERVDLVQVVESLDLDWDHYINNEGENTLALTLDEYARRMDRLLVQLNDLLLEHEYRRARDELENARINDERSRRLEEARATGTVGEWINDPESARLAERSREVLERGRQRYAEIHRLRDRIRTLNRFFTQWLLGMMPTEQAEAFEIAWFRQANPQFFTGLLARAESFAEQILTLTDLTDEQAQKIEQIMAEHRARSLVMMRSMVKHQDRRRELSVRSNTRDGSRAEAKRYQQQYVVPAFDERYRLGNETVERLSHILTDDQLAHVTQPEPVDYLANLQAERRRLQQEVERSRQPAESAPGR